VAANRLLPEQTECGICAKHPSGIVLIGESSQVCGFSEFHRRDPLQVYEIDAAASAKRSMVLLGQTCCRRTS